MTISELSKILGETGILRYNELGFRVRIIDVKNAYGHLRYVVEATDGDGSQATVSADSVTLDSKASR